MSMSIPELHRALRALRLSGMIATLEARAMQVASHEMNFLEAFSWLVQDELDRRRSRLLERRFSSSGLPERKDLKDLDWTYNPKVPKRDILELATLKFIEAREGALLIGQPGTGKSHCAKAIAQLAVQHGYKVFYREAHVLIEEINEAREFGELRKYRAQISGAELAVIDSC
jgi:DNA replication protein DnaC